jgi:hypothetical protein
MRQAIVVGARTNELLAETALHPRGLHWRLAIFRDAGFSFSIRSQRCQLPKSECCDGYHQESEEHHQ